jgi:hypothetical protein
MTVRIPFKKNYAKFGSQVRPFEKADDVGLAITEFMWFDGRPFHPIGSLVDALVAPVRLAARDGGDLDEDNLDLIFQMKEANGGHFFEIILRSEYGTRYGGRAWGQTIEIEDEIIAGHCVLVTRCFGHKNRYEFNADMRRYHIATGERDTVKHITERQLDERLVR